MSEREKPWSKGPWYISDEESNGTVFTEEAFSILSHDHWHIAAVWKDTGPQMVCPTPISEGNARLIAAASELVEALEGFVDAFDGEGADLSGVTDQYRNAKAVLAKIYGDD